MYEIKYRRPEEMKDSGVEWLGLVPKEWEIKKLKYVAECFPSNVDKKSYLGQKTVKLCNYTDVYYNKYITSDIDFMKATASNAEVNRYGLIKGDIVLTKDSESPSDIGIATYINENIKDLVCGYHLAIVKSDSKYNSRYLYYLLLTNRVKNYFATVANGITRFGIGIRGFKDLTICLPSEGQQKIANFLDIKTSQFDSIISKKEKLIEKLEEAKKSLISEVVTGKVKIVDGELVKRQLEEMKDSGVEWLGMIPKSWEHVAMKRVFKIKKKPIYKDDNVVLSLTQKGLKIKDLSNNEGQHAQNYSGYQEVLVDDFVMNHMDLLTGYVDCSPFEGVTSPDYRVFQLIYPEANYNRFYLYFFQMCYKNKIFYGHGQGVSNYGRWRLQTDAFKYFSILKLSYEEQVGLTNALDKKINNIEVLSDKLEKQIQNLKQAKQSLISEAVTGKIDLRDWEIIEEGEV